MVNLNADKVSIQRSEERAIPLCTGGGPSLMTAITLIGQSMHRETDTISNQVVSVAIAYGSKTIDVCGSIHASSIIFKDESLE